MRKSTKIIIVGAGPVGCYAGQLLKQLGFNPLLLEEHSEVGKPVQCAGIVGRKVFEELRLKISNKSILNRIDGGEIFYNGTSLKLIRPKVAYIINREIFDKELSKGLNIEYKTSLLNINPSKDGYGLKTNNGEYFANLVIGADGPNSRVRKALGFSSEIQIYRGCQFRVKMAPRKQNFVEVHYVKPFSFFNWIIPEGNGTVRIGSINKEPYRELLKFIEKQNIKADIIEKNAGTIPIGTCQIVKGNALLVGDAAGQIKPITSGGIYYGLKAAEFLVDAISENNLSLYKDKWKKEFNNEIKICLLARNLIENLGEDVLSRLFYNVKENVALIEKTGDFENHSSIFWGLISNPRNFPIIGKMIMSLLKNPRLLLHSLKTF